MEFSEYIEYIQNEIKKDGETYNEKYGILFIIGILSTKFTLENKKIIATASSFIIEKLKNEKEKMMDLLKDVIIAYDIEDIIFQAEKIINTIKTEDGFIEKEYTLPKNIIISQADSFNTKYSFDNYLVDSTNHSAYMTMKSVAEGNYGGKIITLYGPTGVGKTHLVSAMLNAFSEKYEGKSAYYFVKSYWVELIKKYSSMRQLEIFLREINKADIIAIDDLSFICDTNRPVYIQLIYDLINLRVVKEKVTVITTPVQPDYIKLNKELADNATGSYFELNKNGDVVLGSPFVSRLKSNMIYISEPSFNLKLLFAKRVLKYSLQIDFEELNKTSQDILAIIIDSHRGDFRYINGIMNELLEKYTLHNNINSAIMELADNMGLKEKLKINNQNHRINYLVERMCEKFSIRLSEIQGRLKKGSELKIIRNAIIYVLNKYHDFSFQAISEVFKISKVSAHSGYGEFEEEIEKNNEKHKEVLDIIIRV